MPANKKNKRRIAVLRLTIVLVLAASTQPVSATPIAYEFRTGTTAFSLPAGSTLGLAAALTGSSVSGTFVYDADAPTTIAVTTGPTAGSDIHTGAITSISGTIAGLSFSDMLGAVTIGDEAYTVPNVPTIPTADLLQLSGFAPNEPSDFLGFTVNGFDLMNVRLFWLENLLTLDPIPDFLTGNALPTVLPTFNGRLALDFGTHGVLNPLSVVFFDGLTVSPVTVPEPSTLLLLGAALLGFAATRRRIAAIEHKTPAC